MEDKQFLKQLGLRMKCTRIMTELEVKQVAEKSGLAPTTINKMERGLKDFHILNIKRLADVYGVELNEMFSLKL